MLWVLISCQRLRPDSLKRKTKKTQPRQWLFALTAVFKYKFSLRGGTASPEIRETGNLFKIMRIAPPAGARLYLVSCVAEKTPANS